MTNYTTGLEAEERAVDYLQQQGFALLHQRYRNAYGEIDLIVSRGNELRFIEVKARRDLEQSLYALQPKQQERLWHCAEGFLAENPHYREFEMQFDLIAIAGSQLHHEAHILSA